VQKDGLAITWSPESAGGFTIEQARNRSMSHHRHVYRVNGDVTQFTPYRLHADRRYFFRVRAVNGSGTSRYSAPVSGRFRTHQTRVQMMTWNVLHHQFDGTRENGNKIAPWHKRLKVVVSMIKHSSPDIININEANDWVGRPRHRQIDTIEAKLKGTYRLASADFTAAKYHPQVGNYVLYRRSMFRARYQHDHGKAHFWELSNKHFVMYQALQDRHSGAKFLMVSVHLSHGPNDARSDAQRKKETQRLLADVRKLKAHHPKYRKLPVIYAGDTNSFAGKNPANHDSPGDLMKRAHVTDSLMAAQSRKNTRYGSVNGYYRRPSRTGRIIDHFYGTAGVAFRTWRQVMHLKHGHWPGTIPSDHNPIMVGLSLQK
jgi:endonuclease/exonuclease/phosphatase (EEP) superfamily protein YafD